MTEAHKVVHLSTTPKSHKGCLTLRGQRCYNVGHNEVHIAFQDEALHVQVRHSVPTNDPRKTLKIVLATQRNLDLPGVDCDHRAEEAQ